MCFPGIQGIFHGYISPMHLHDLFVIESESPIRSYLRDSFAASASWNGSKIDENELLEIPAPLSLTDI